MRGTELLKRLLVLFFLLLGAATAQAHFGLILPSSAIITQDSPKTLILQLKFLHPMEGQYMEMAPPKRFGVMHGGNKTDLREGLSPAKGNSADQGEAFTFWSAEYQIRRPGDYIFYLEPAPNWEPAEDKFIVHYTKVCVNALGLEQGWDQPVGLETEIVPLTRPYSLWSGNLFSGRVLLKGKPLPFAEVEVEYLNESPENSAIVKAPADPFVTQVVKADGNGVFHYAMPRAGWWGFAALSEATWTLKHQGQNKVVEIGAVFWVQARDMQ